MVNAAAVADGSALRENLGDEIYDIFVEEVDEIIDDMKGWVPQWDQSRGNTEILADIRRAFHTLKGSGRMLGGLALGDYAWAHENMLNQVLEGRLPRNNYLAKLLHNAVAFLDSHTAFFLTATESSASSQAEIEKVNRFEAAPERAVADMLKPAPVLTTVDFSERPSVTKFSETLHLSSPEHLRGAALEPIEVHFNEDEENRIIWKMFREELPEQLQTIDQLMQVLFSDSRDVEARRSLERELHTLKGGARMAQLQAMGDSAHQAEELLVAVGRRRDKDVSPDIDNLQAHIDHISVLAEQFALSALSVDEPDESAADSSDKKNTAMSFMVERLGGEQDASYGSYLEQLLNEKASELPDISVLNGLQDVESDANQLANDGTATTAVLGQEQIRLSATSLDTMVENANMLKVQQNTLVEHLQTMSDDVGEFGRTASRLKQLLRSLEMETEARIHAGYKESAAANGHSSEFDPLEMDEYSEVQRLSRALAESLNDLVNIEGDLNMQLRGADRFVKESLNTSRELHHDLLATRLVEVSVVMPRLRRILRQTAAELNHKVTLEVEGEALKLDRHLLQRMTAPIEHMLRNAVSHGIESPEQREENNKPESGKITLKVYREDTDIVFCIDDDGQGLNSHAIRDKAIALGLLAVDEEVSEQDIYRLILRPGFTTAQQVSQIAGRGVGMDVVNSEIKAMGGNLLIHSTPGEGTKFTIRLPFAMAANPVLFVDVQQQSYALPLGSVQGLIRMDAATLQQHLANDDKPLPFNDDVYPVHYMGLALGHERGLNLDEDNMYVVVYTRTGGYCIAWVVDSVVGRRDVILQSLGALFKTCRFYSAATIASDGQVVMVPDMLELTERVLTTPDAERDSAAAKLEVTTAAVVKHEHPHVMIVDDSITVRKVTEKLLAHENYVLETAKDGLEALEKLDRFSPDLLLLDIEMPRMDGFEVLSAVRSNPRWKSLPIIMISSRTAEKHREHAKQLGATDFLGKPYQSQTLLERIRKYLGAEPLVLDRPFIEEVVS